MPHLKAVLLDLGGVVYVGDRPLPGAVAAIRRLRAAGLAVRFLTNTTRSPQRVLAKMLAGMGVECRDGELFTPARAARRVIEARGLAPHLLVHPALLEDFAGIPANGAAAAVVVGDAGDNFSYAALNAAFRRLVRGAEFLALAENRSFRDADGELSLDAGPFVAALASASGRQPVVLGKPAPEFYREALASLGCDPGEAAMIGDDVESDVAGAQAAGIAGILVRTGKYEPGDEARIATPPDLVADDLTAAVDWLLEARGG